MKERLQGRWFFLLLCLLWGGIMTANAEKKAWVKCDRTKGTITFYYTEKGTLGTDEYELKTKIYDMPGWTTSYNPSNQDYITKAIFDASFAEARPTMCYRWFYDCEKLTTIEGMENLNTSQVTAMQEMFDGCKSLQSIDLSHFDTSNVENFIGMFANCTGLTSLDVSKFNTSKATTMDSMFRSCSKLTTVDTSKFDTKNILSLRWMFGYCRGMTSIDLSNFDTQSLKTVELMFQNCTNLRTIDLSSFDTQKVTNTRKAFDGCSQLKTIYTTENFTVDKVTDSEAMFDGCTSLLGAIAFDSRHIDSYYAKVDGGYFTDKQYTGAYAVKSWDNLTFYYGYKKDRDENVFTLNNDNEIPGWYQQRENIGKVYFKESFRLARPTSCYKWFSGFIKLYVDGIRGLENLNTSEVTRMDYMFEGCSSLGYLEGLTYLNTQKVTTMRNMFSGCTALKSDKIDFSNFDTQNVTDMGYMFQKCSSLTSLDLSSFNTSKVTKMGNMFENCSALTSLDLSNFNTSGVTYMSFMFQNCKGLESINLSHFDTQKVTSMDGMFYGCEGLKSIDLSKLNIQKATNLMYMFSGCTGLTSVKMPKGNTQKVQNMGSIFSNCSSLTTLDMSGFDTQSVTSMYSMFFGCSSLTSIDLTNFNTENVTDMTSMFSGCSKLNSIVLSNFNTSKTTSMFQMFRNCALLTSLDLSGLNTQNVLNMQGMFMGCSSLNTIDLSSFNTGKVQDMGQMFSGCSSLSTLDLSNFDTQNVQRMYQMFENSGKISVYLGENFIKSQQNNSDMFLNSDITMYSLPSNYATNKTAFSGITVKPYVPINAKSEYGTICVPLGSKLTADSYTGFDKLYTVKAADADKGTVTLAEATSIMPGVAYVYHRALAADATKSVITFEADDNATTYDPVNDGNLLKGTFERITAPGGSYILQTDGNFHPVALGNTTLGVGAYRAYLDLGQNLQAQSLRFVFGDATGINNVNTNMANLPNIYFDLSGRKVENPQRGNVYINNGRKIVF